MSEFEGKVVLVTGGGSGIGRATAIAFAQEGAKVSILDVDKKGAEETRKLTSAGLVVVGDVSKSADCKRAVSEVVKTFKRLDILVNNAGVECQFTPVEKASEEDWNRVMGIDLTGVFLMSKHAIPHLSDGGAIVNLSSSLGFQPSEQLAPYCAAKAGVIMLTRVMALELAPRIRVNCICPGPIDTPLLRRFTTPKELGRITASQPLRRLGKPEEVADAILFLCSRRASYITGAVLSVGAQI
ncbi:SDR family oxidoreductase [Candidatus Micrarchaeota archaeon]|nr:SDR family oxidoreductase [Candidatus Micrarchaeota archaeon]